MVQAHPAVMSAEHHLGFFQRKSVQVLLPFATSLVLHLGLVVFGLAVYKAVTVITVTRSQIAGPVAGGIDGVPIDKIDLNNIPGVGQDARERAQNLEMNDVDPQSQKFTPGSAEKVNLNQDGGTGGGDIAPGTLIGFGPNKGNNFGLPGTGGVEGPKGKWGRFGTPSDGGPGTVFQAPMARKIVFVCDATGSMTPVFSSLRRELSAAVDRLDEKNLQFFNVIFFSDDKVLSLAPGLVKADPDNKLKAAAFFNDTTPRGLTNPLPAIRKAFEQNPEVIYVLTDGFDQVNDLESVVREFDALNKDRKVRVHTILVGSGEQKELVDVLERIAKQSNGTFKNVSKEDF